MKKTIITGILFAVAGTLYAQQVPALGTIYLTPRIDSLKATLPSKTGLERLLTLLSLEKNTELWDTQKDTLYLHQIQKELARYPDAVGHYRYFKAKKEAAKKNTEVAFLDSKVAYEFYKTHRDTVGMVSALLNMGILAADGRGKGAKDLGPETRQAEIYLKEAMQLSERTGNPEVQILHSYSFARSLGREGFFAHSRKLIPEVQKALGVVKLYPQYSAYATFLFNLLTLIYESKQEYAKAGQMTLEQISIFKKNVGKAPVSVLINLGLSYENQHLYAEAEKVYREAMDAARETDFISKMKISAGMHASLAGQKKYREAAPWADSIYTYAEKFTVHKSETKIREVVTAYEVEKKEAANQLLQREKQLIETRSQLYIGLGLTALIALLGVSFLVYRLRQNNAKLQAAYSEILQLNQARDYFFGVIAHDLRRPMSGFQDMAGLITYYLQQKRYGELDKISQSIEQMGQRIRLLLDNLLSWALSQREEVPYYPEKILFNEKIKQITGLYQQIAQYRNVQLIVECPKELTVYMDPNACELIIRNLIDNALKSARSGGQIRLIAKEDKEGYANVTVEDDGQGMAEEKLTMVRQILRQPELRADRPRGLGMILLGRFLKSNHIQVDINSTLGIGTRFLMNVPMA